tara:strand:- start:341 stop:733 length:393 start_codon:yes stop_codon:yes gene_type:complete
MVKNQLFRILPDIEIINKILETFGLTSLNDTKIITKETIKENDTINKLNDIKDVLETYYLPCKTLYIRDISDKRCIVILRQFIRVHGYTLMSKERHIDGKKINIYRIIEDDKPESKTTNKQKKPIVISFS